MWRWPAGGTVISVLRGNGDGALAAADSAGQTGTSSVTLHPQTVRITLDTSPPGLQVVHGDESRTASLSRTPIADSTHTIFSKRSRPPRRGIAVELQDG